MNQKKWLSVLDGIASQSTIPFDAMYELLHACWAVAKRGDMESQNTFIRRMAKTVTLLGMHRITADVKLGDLDIRWYAKGTRAFVTFLRVVEATNASDPDELERQLCALRVIMPDVVAGNATVTQMRDLCLALNAENTV